MPEINGTSPTDLAAVRDALGMGSTRRFLPAGNRFGTHRTASTGTPALVGYTMMTARYHRTPNVALTNLRLIVPWWRVDQIVGETTIGNGATVKSAIHYQFDGGARLPFQKDGQNALALNDMQTMLTDSVGGYLPANSRYSLKTWADPGASGYLPSGRNCLRSADGSLSGFGGPDGVEYLASGSGTDKTLSGTVTGTAGNDTSLEGILVGESREYVPSFGGIGDSRMNGVDELDASQSYKGRTNAGDAYGNIGWFERLFGGAGYPHINMGQSASKTQTWAGPGYMSRRSYILGLTCSHIVIQLVHNDLSTPRTAAQILADHQTIVNNCRPFAQKIWVCTDMPSTTSTDGFATVANQTVSAYESVRQDVNAGIRGGQLSGIAGVIDLDALMRDPVQTTKWQVGFTIDGVHPTTAAMIYIASTLRASDYV